MECKDNREQNPPECRRLRSTDTKLREEIRKVSRDRNRWVNKLEDLRDARSRKKTEYDARKRSAVVSVGASAIPGVVGNAAGPTAAGDVAALSVLQAQINELTRQITQTGYQIEPLNEQQRRLESSLSQNASQMRSLNCVLP